MSLEKTFEFKGVKDKKYPIIQGGMGVGISLEPLASAVNNAEGIGTLSSACLDRVVTDRLNLKKKLSITEAIEIEVAETKENSGMASINIMCALRDTYDESVEGAIKGGINVIVSGAGMPFNLPELVKKFTGTNDHEIGLVPIISSARALENLVKRRWEKIGYRPDAIVLEGPKAGGHLGFNYKMIEESGKDFLTKYDLFNELLGPVLDFVEKYPNDLGPIPVIVAGGIYTHEDILYALNQGAKAVQMGTRFVTTNECSASPEMKQSYLDATAKDIAISDKIWASPSGYPFRYLKTSPLARDRMPGDSFCLCTTLLGITGVKEKDLTLSKREFARKYPGFSRQCPEGYVPKNRKTRMCPAEHAPSYASLFTCGTNVSRVDKITTVPELMEELIG